MAETATADIAEKPLAYQEGLKGFLASQAQPRNFLESPMAGLIPGAGPWLRAAGSVQQQKRLQEAMIKAAYFDTAVKTGDFTPDHPAAQGIPLPIIQAGLLEAEKVRATPGYQGRQLFKEAMPSWQGELQGPYEDEGPDRTFSPQRQRETAQRHQENFQAFAQHNPELFATLGSPDTGRLAIENVSTPANVARLQQRGYPTPGWGPQGAGGQAPPPQVTPPGEITQTPMERPVTTGPGSTIMQEQTGLAGRAQAAGANPRMVIALRATEGSKSWQVSPKGAASEFQLMPETARPYLSTEQQGWSVDRIRTTLKNDPKLAESVAIRHIKDLEAIWPDNPQAVAAAYFSGPGNVRKDGTIINWERHDGTATKPGTTVRQYVDRFMQHYNGQNPGSEPAPGLTRGPGQALVSGLPDESTPPGQVAQGQVARAQAPQAQTRPSDTSYRPFDVNAPRPVSKSTTGFSGGKLTWSDEEVPLADAAAAHMAEAVSLDPANYKAAYLDLAQKKALPDPKQLQLIQAGVVRALYQRHEQSLINQGYKGTSKALQTEALNRTVADTGIAMTPELATAIQNEPLNSDVITTLRERATLETQAGLPGDALRKQQRESEELKARNIQKQTGEVRADMPLAQLPDGPALAQKYGVPGTTTLKELSSRVLLPDEIKKQGEGVAKIQKSLSILEQYYYATNPVEKGAFLANLRGFLRDNFGGRSFDPNMTEFKDLAHALAGILGPVATESGGRYSDKDIERYLLAIPGSRLTAEQAGQRFKALGDILGEDYYQNLHTFLTGKAPLLERYYERFPAERPAAPGTSTAPGTSPTPGQRVSPQEFFHQQPGTP